MTIAVLIENYDSKSNQFINYLESLNYSEGRIRVYKTGLSKIKCFIKNNRFSCFDKTSLEEYIKYVLQNSDYSSASGYNKDQIRVANAFMEYCISGTIAFRNSINKITFKGAIGNIIQSYLDYRKSNGISKDTLDSNKTYLLRFNDYLINHGICKPNEINNQVLFTYVSSLCIYTKATIHCTLCSVRVFLRHLFESEITKENLSQYIPKDNYKKHKNIPTTFTEEEIESLINSIDRGNPKGKRDYVIILLAARLGLRASDICCMKFTNLNWEKNIISIKQQKTSKKIELPLLSEVGNSIIDYLKYARPVSDSPFVFLHVNGRFERLHESTLHSIVTEYLIKAGIKNVKTKKHGPHALRHSLAGRLLEKKTPLPVISEVLGHSNTESTKSYIRIDINSLRDCALEVPPLNNDLYSMGRLSNG